MEEEREFYEYKKKILAANPDLKGDIQNLNRLNLSNEAFHKKVLIQSDMQLLKENLSRVASTEQYKEFSYRLMEAFFRDPTRLFKSHTDSLNTALDFSLPNMIKNSKSIEYYFNLERVQRYRNKYKKAVPLDATKTLDKEEDSKDDVSLKDSMDVASSSSEKGSEESKSNATTPSKKSKTPAKKEKKPRKSYERFLDGNTVCKVYKRNLRIEHHQGGKTSNATSSPTQTKKGKQGEEEEEEEDIDYITKCLRENRNYSVASYMEYVVEVTGSLRNIYRILEWDDLSEERLRDMDKREEEENLRWTENEKIENDERTWFKLKQRHEEDDEKTSLEMEKIGEDSYRVVRRFKSLYTGDILIAVQSNRCFHLGEKRHLPGGYMIYQGNQKVFTFQEDYQYNRFRIVQDGKKLHGKICCKYRDDSSAFNNHTLSILPERRKKGSDDVFPLSNSRVFLTTSSLESIPLFCVLIALIDSCEWEKICIDSNKNSSSSSSSSSRATKKKSSKTKKKKNKTKKSRSKEGDKEDEEENLEKEQALYQNGLRNAVQRLYHHLTDSICRFLGDPKNNNGGKNEKQGVEINSTTTTTNTNADTERSLLERAIHLYVLPDLESNLETLTDREHHLHEIGIHTKKNKAPTGGKEMSIKVGEYYIKHHLLPLIEDVANKDVANKDVAVANNENFGLKFETLCFWIYSMLRVQVGIDQVQQTNLGDKYLLSEDDFYRKIFFAWNQKTDKTIYNRLGRIYSGMIPGTVTSDDYTVIFGKIEGVTDILNNHVAKGSYSDGFVGVSAQLNTSSRIATLANLARVQLRNKGGNNTKLSDKTNPDNERYPFFDPNAAPDGAKTSEVRYTSLPTVPSNQPNLPEDIKRFDVIKFIESIVVEWETTIEIEIDLDLNLDLDLDLGDLDESSFDRTKDVTDRKKEKENEIEETTASFKDISSKNSKEDADLTHLFEEGCNISSSSSSSLIDESKRTEKRTTVNNEDGTKSIPMQTEAIGIKKNSSSSPDYSFYFDSKDVPHLMVRCFESKSKIESSRPNSEPKEEEEEEEEEEKKSSKKSRDTSSDNNNNNNHPSLFDLPEYNYILFVEGVSRLERSKYQKIPPKVLCDVLIMAKRMHLLHEHLSPYYDPELNAVYIKTQMGRPMFPVLAGDFLRDTKTFQRETAKGKKIGWSDWVRKGYIYYLDPNEIKNQVLAPYVEDYLDESKRSLYHYTCSMIHPSMAKTVHYSLNPYPSLNNAVRVTFSGNIGPQYFGAQLYDETRILQTNYSYLVHPQIPLVHTQQYKLLGFKEKPQGINMCLLMGTFLGLTIEDSICLRKSVVDTMMTDVMKYKCFTSSESRNTCARSAKTGNIKKESKRINHTLFTKPNSSSDHSHDTSNSHLDEYGLAKVGSRVQKRDILFNRIQVPVYYDPSSASSAFLTLLDNDNDDENNNKKGTKKSKTKGKSELNSSNRKRMRPALIYDLDTVTFERLLAERGKDASVRLEGMEKATVRNVFRFEKNPELEGREGGKEEEEKDKRTTNTTRFADKNYPSRPNNNNNNNQTSPTPHKKDDGRIFGAKIQCATHKKIQIGSKFATTAPQKSILSYIINDEDAPFDPQTGQKPEAIINPHNFSRYTESQQYELLAGLLACDTMEFQDGTAFESPNPEKKFGELFEKHGFKNMGSRILINGITGEEMVMRCYMGFVCYQLLMHVIEEKMMVRATGPVNTMTREPLQGGSKDGGPRFGEMERDSMMSHGATHIIKGLSTKQSTVVVPICYRCNKHEGIEPFKHEHFLKVLSSFPTPSSSSSNGDAKKNEENIDFSKGVSSSSNQDTDHSSKNEQEDKEYEEEVQRLKLEYKNKKFFDATKQDAKDRHWCSICEKFVYPDFVRMPYASFSLLTQLDCVSINCLKYTQ